MLNFKYEDIFNSIIDGIQVIDIEGKIIYANKAYHRILGYPAGVLVGKFIYDTLLQETSQQLLNYIQFLVNNKPEPSPWIGKALRFDGSDIYVKTAWNYIIHQDTVIGFVSMITDFTNELFHAKKFQEGNGSPKTELDDKTTELNQTKNALKVLINTTKKTSNELNEQIELNYESILSPLIQTLKSNLKSNKEIELIDIIDLELKNIISPYSKKMMDPLTNLTPTEIQISNLIKHGKSNKEISEMLYISTHTVSNHREKIRTKLGLKNRKINLRSFLLSLN